MNAPFSTPLSLRAWLVPAALLLLAGQSGDAWADRPPCPAAGLDRARKLSRQKKDADAAAAFAALPQECLGEEDLLDLAWALERLGRSREAHDVHVRIASAYPEDARVRYLAGKEQKLRVAPVSKLSIRVEPPGALVVVDGVEKGLSTPGASMDLDLPGGQHRVQAASEGYQPQERLVTLEFGEPVSLALDLEPIETPQQAVAPAPDAPAPAPVVHAAPVEQPPAVAEDAPGSGPLVAVLAGVALADYGDPSLSVGAGLAVAAQGGYLWRAPFGLTWLGLQAHALLLYTPVHDSAAEDDAGFVSVAAGGGIRFFVWRLWLDLGLSVGTAILVGASEKSFFFEGATEVSGAFATLLVRPALTLGWQVWRGLTLVVQPALEYTPRIDDFDESITHVLRYGVIAGGGWQW